MKEKIIRIAPILLIVAIAILSIILIVNLGRAMFGATESGNSSQTAQQDTSVADLLKVEAGRSVKMTVRGPIVAKEDAAGDVLKIARVIMPSADRHGFAALADWLLEWEGSRYEIASPVVLL